MTPNNHTGSQQDTGPSFQSQLGPLLFLAMIFFLNFISRIIMAPLMPAIEQDLKITHAQAGSLFFLISLGYFPALMGSGFISSWLSHRKTIYLSSAILGVTLLVVSRCHSLWAIYTGMVILGFSAGFYLPSGMATLTSLVSSRHWGKAVGIHELGPTLSFLTAPLLSEALLHWISWRGVLAVLGVVALLLGITYARFGKGGEFKGEAPRGDAFRTLLASRGFWVMLLLFGLGIAGTLGVYTMLPLYLVAEKGLERNWANMLIAVSRILCPGVVFLAGWGTDRFGAKKTLLSVFFLTGLATILMGLTDGIWLVVIVVLQPLLASCFFPAGFAALSMVVPAAIRNVAVSFTVPFGFVIGGGLVPLLIGIAGDAGSFALGIAVVGGLIFTGTVFSRLLKNI